MGAAGALMGADLVKPALFYTAFIGAFLAVMMVIWRKDFWVRINQGLCRLMFWNKQDQEKPGQSPPIAVPYGLAIAAGCLLALIVKGAG
jgi:Flp pilus assembly protein protease CpaA